MPRPQSPAYLLIRGLPASLPRDPRRTPRPWPITPNPPSPLRWNVAVAALASSWGLIAVIVREVDLDAQVLVFYRLAFAALTLGLVALVVRRVASLRLVQHRRRIVIIGLTLAAHWFLYFATIKLSSVAVAVLLAYLAPIAIALIAPFVLPEGRSVVALVALVPAGAGVALVALGGEGGGAIRPLALLCGLLTAATYAALVLMTKRIAAEVPVLAISFWNYAIAAVAIAPLLLVGDRVLPTGRELPAVLALGVVFTALSGYLYIWFLRHVTAQAIGVLAYIEPVSAALLAWALLDEALGWQVIVGGVLVIVAGATVVFLEPADAAAPEAAPLTPR
jgi:drug/metabolite transporter (DMT)-like permease